MATSGPVTPGEALFARYALPPNELGYCGPPGTEVLLAGGAAAGEGREVRERAPAFDGAWPYLQLLAGAAALTDPLDLAVVSSYWLGGALCDAVPPDSLLAAARQAFAGQPGVPDRLTQVPAVTVGGPSHLFHVFVVYPWVGLLGSGGDVPRSVLDRCRVRWGTVESVAGETAVVSSSALTWDGRVLGLGAARSEPCRWARGGHAFVHDPRPGDTVALHWDWVCDRLGAGEAARLQQGTADRLQVTNAWLAGRVPAGGARVP